MAIIAENMHSIGLSSQTFTIDWDTEYLDIKFTDYSGGLFGTDYYYKISNNLDYSKSLYIDSADGLGFVDVPDYFLMSDFDTIRYSKDHGVLAVNENGEIVCEIDTDTTFANNNEITISSCIESANGYDGGGTFNIIKTPIPTIIVAEYKFNNTLYNLIPEFNAEFTNYIYEDVVEGNITTRTIYGDSLPTLIRFGKVGSDSDKTNSLLEVNYINTSNINDMTYMFSYCKSLTSINTNNWDTSRLINIQSMFYYCEKLTSLDLSSWDTSNIKYMDRVFYCCLSLKSLDLSKWDTSNVVDIARMFSYCSQMTKLNLSGWNVDKVVDTTMAFAYCNKLQAIRIFNCKPNMITTLNYSSLFPTEIISGKTRVIYCDEDTAGILQPPTNWVFSFEDDSIIAKYVFNINIDTLPTFNDGYVYTVNDVYNGDGTTTRTITSDSSPSSMSFREKSGLISVSKLNTSGLTDMSYMFYQCTNLTSVDVSKWNTSNVTNMSYMFNKCTNLTSVDLSNFDTSNVINMYSMFYGCSSLTSLDLSNFNTSNVNDMCNMFRECINLTSIDVSNWDTGNVKNMSYMFYQCYDLTTIEGLSNWNNGNVKNMSCMFYNCSSLLSLDLSGWDTSQVTSFNQMFYYCNKLTMIKGLSNWDTSEVTNMDYMFYENKLLKTLDLSGWDTSKVTTMDYMFYYCNKLEYLNLSGWDLSAVTTYNNIFPSTSGVLNHISLYHCPVGTINFIIENVKAYNVPDKIIEVGNADISMLKVKVANNKGWYIVNYLISKFIFDNTIEDTLPVCNDEFEFDCQDNVNGNYTTRIINGHSLPYHISFRDSMGLLEMHYLNTKGLDSLNSIFRNCKSLRKVNISKFDIEDVIDFNSMFYLCKDLSEIVAEGVKPEVINKIIEFLPNKKSPFGGIIKVNSGFDLDSINVEIANNKSWEITDNIFVRYLFDKTIEENVDPYLDNRCTTKLVLLNDINNICTKVLINDIHAEEMISPTIMRFSNKIGLIEVKEIQVDTLFSLADMFYKCTNLVEIKFSTGGNAFGNLDNMFYGCESLVKADFSRFAVHHNIDQTRCMFEGCTSLREVPGVNNLGSYDAAFMFKDCTSLTSINLEYTYFYGDMEGFFEGCINLKEIKHLDDYSYMNDIFNASKMFKNCKSLTDIPIGGSLYVSDPFIFDMFEGCDSLERINIVDANSTDTEAMNKYIEALPTVEAGGHHVIVTNGFTINEEVAAAKNWEVRCHYLYNIVITESGNTPSVSFDTTSEHNQLVKYKKLPDNTYNSACYADLLPTRYQFTVINSKLLSLSYINTSNVTSMYNMFYDCRGLVSADLSNCDTSKVTDMRNVFQNCITLTELDLSNWNTSKVTNMEFMFHQCRAVTSINVSGWSTSKVTSMNSMFKECENLISIEGISSFNPKLVTGMTMMFYQCNKLLKLDLSNWDTSKVTGMGSMFRYCRRLTELDLSNWNTSNVTRMANMFEYCNNLTSLDLSNFNTSNVTDMSYMFKDCYKLESVKLNNFRWTNISNGCFSGCSKLREVDVTNMSTTYSLLEYLINDLPSRTANSPGIIRTGNYSYTEANYNAAIAKNWIIEPNADVTNLKRTIAKYTFNSDTDTLPRFNEGYVYIYTDVDNGDGTITRTITSNSLPSRITFSSETGLIGLSYLNTDNVTDMNNMFWFCSNLTSVDLSSFNTSKVTNMYAMFSGCKKLTTIEGLSSFNTSNVTTMECMFWSCVNLTSLDVSSFDTSNVTNMCDMFRYCEKLSSLDLSNFDTSKVTTMKDMFYNCKALTSLDISNFDTSKVTDMSGMFRNCDKLSLIRANNLSPSTINAVIGQLPTVSSPNYGILKIGKTDITDVDTATANDNLWFVNGIKIAEYEFSTDFDPTFNEGFEYTAITNGNSKIIMSNGVRPTSILFKGMTGLTKLNYLDTSEVTNMHEIFLKCSLMTEVDLSNFDTSKVTNMGFMFSGCKGLTSIDLSSLDTSEVTIMAYMLEGCTGLTTIDVSNFDTRKVTKMHDMFWANTSLISIEGINNFDVRNVTSISYMFAACEKLVSLDLSNWNTNKLKNMDCAFTQCKALTSLSINNFNVSNVTDMNNAFYECMSLSTLDLSSWKPAKVKSMYQMFKSCKALTSLDIRNWCFDSVTETRYMFDNYTLAKIRLDECSVDTINLVIQSIANRTKFAPTIGKLYITGINDYSTIDKTTATSKNWKIVIKENRMNSFIPINLGGKSIRAIYTNNETYL